MLSKWILASDTPDLKDMFAGFGLYAGIKDQSRVTFSGTRLGSSGEKKGQIYVVFDMTKLWLSLILQFQKLNTFTVSLMIMIIMKVIIIIM